MKSIATFYLFLKEHSDKTFSYQAHCHLLIALVFKFNPSNVYCKDSLSVF